MGRDVYGQLPRLLRQNQKINPKEWRSPLMDGMDCRGGRTATLCGGGGGQRTSGPSISLSFQKCTCATRHRPRHAQEERMQKAEKCWTEAHFLHYSLDLELAYKITPFLLGYAQILVKSKCCLNSETTTKGARSSPIRSCVNSEIFVRSPLSKMTTLFLRPLRARMAAAWRRGA